MGNTIGKDKGEDSADGGQLVPHGIYKGPIDWDCRIVRKLIIERKLAPFYKGLSDYDESSDEVTLTTHNPPRNGEVKKSATSNGEANAPTNRELKRSTVSTTASISKGKDVPQAKSLETQLYRGAVECPICFLYYPRNINHSRCCDQPICTECFVQIKRPENGSLGANNSPAVCPFCVEPNFGVCYKPPSFSTGIGALDAMTSSSSQNLPNSLLSNSPTFLNSQETKLRRKSVSHRNPEVVTSDTIRPDWATRAAQLSRQQDARRFSGSTPNTTTQRRLAIRSGNGAGNFVGTQTPQSRRNHQPGGSEFNSYIAAMRSMGTDLEELMIMEAIRLSLSEQEERERRERDERERTEGGESNTSEAMLVEDTANSPSSSSGHVPLDSVERLEEDDKNSPNTIQSQDNTGTPITTITSTENITNTSVASSSSPSSSPTNSTNDPLSTPSPLPSPGTRHIIGIASTSNVPTPSFDDHTNETPPQIEQDDNEGQTSTHTSGSVDIKKAPIIIFPSNAIVSEGTVFGNKREGDSGDSRGGSWEPA